MDVIKEMRRVMKAISYEMYGEPEVLIYKTVDKPKAKDNEVLIHIITSSVTHGDIRMRAANPFLARLHSGLFKPTKYPILGFECSGIVESIGKSVVNYEVGDEVMAFAGIRFGAYAEYITIQTDGRYKYGALVKKPSNISFDEAGVSPTGGITAIGFLKDLGIENAKGKRILIIGASGSVGSFAVQIAKYYGALITGVTSTKNIQLVKSLGANEVIDYKKNDFTSSDVKYDMVFDAVGLYKKSKCKKVLTNEGKFASVSGSSKSGDKALELLAELMEKGHIKPVIDKTYSWNDIVEAHRYVDKGHKVGNVVFRVTEEL